MLDAIACTGIDESAPGSYKPCFDRVLRTLGIPTRKETLEGLVWLSESIEVCLTTF